MRSVVMCYTQMKRAREGVLQFVEIVERGVLDGPFLMTYRTGRIVLAYRLLKSAALPAPCFAASRGAKTILNRFYLLADYSPSGRKRPRVTERSS